jgi:fucose 4-O-acetylase-like acetyltransferase
MIISGFFSAQNPNPKRAIHTLVLMFVAFILIFFLMGIFYLAFSNHAKLNDVNDIHTLIGA